MLVALKEPAAAAKSINAARVNNPNLVAPNTATINSTTSIIRVAIDD